MVQGKLKLIDFGISVGVSDEQTSMIIAQPEGTPNYIAPEVWILPDHCIQFSCSVAEIIFSSQMI